MHFSLVASLLGLIVLVGAFPVQITDTPAQPVLNVQRFSLTSLAAAVPAEGAQSLTSMAVPLTLISPFTTRDQIADAANVTTQVVERMSNDQASAFSTVQDSNETAEKIPIYYEYEVQPGDTLLGIAQRFGIGIDYITWNNADVTNANDITPGLILLIPSVEGIIHSVRINETVTEIADRYDADYREIIDFRANGLEDPNAITPGTMILVPGGEKKPLVVAPPERPAPATAAGASDGGWVWPTAGSLTSPFGPTHPLGIDVAAPVGTAITAASSGTVTFVGGNGCCSYGLHVIIDHGNGYETLYAHFDYGSFAVSVGQQVAPGDYLGTIGLTGRTTGPHVHFELRRHGVYQDPLWYLP